MSAQQLALLKKQAEASHAHVLARKGARASWRQRRERQLRLAEEEARRQKRLQQRRLQAEQEAKRRLASPLGAVGTSESGSETGFDEIPGARTLVPQQQATSVKSDDDGGISQQVETWAHSGSEGDSVGVSSQDSGSDSGSGSDTDTDSGSDLGSDGTSNSSDRDGSNPGALSRYADGLSKEAQAYMYNSFDKQLAEFLTVKSARGDSFRASSPRQVRAVHVLCGRRVRFPRWFRSVHAVSCLLA